MSSRTFIVHQFHDTAQPFDAVSNHMRLIQESLRDIGIGGEIFARRIRPDDWSAARQFNEKQIWNCDLLLIHHSQGSPWLNRALSIEVPKAVIYHNITPAEYFAHDPYIADLCRLGRGQLLLLQKAVKRAFADSAFNAAELRDLGFAKPTVFPLLNLEGVSTSSRRSKQLKKLLFVGKITPHKNQALLLKTLYYLKRILPETPRLTLVGGSDPLYGRYVRQLAQLLGLKDNVDWRGKATTKEIEEYYRNADAYVSTSLHEGFGVPLLEAMRNGLPVFALPSAAVPETLGDSGVKLKSHRPHRIAEQIAVTLADENERSEILERQSQRMKDLKKFQNSKQIQRLIRETLHDLHA